MLVGFEANDDAAVYRLRDDLVAVLTVDFLTPIVDDPYDFGRIAGANALSDVFAMGARPVCALNVLALDSALGPEVAGEILRGGADAAREAGAIVVGGHSVDDAEPKYGLCVLGTARPEEIVRNEGALPGDALYLTKPLGTGVMSAAAKVGAVDEAGLAPAVASMRELNRAGAEAAAACNAHALTDVTGFGLAGHLHEMLAASGCAAEIDWTAVPLFEGALELARAYCRPSRTFSLVDFAAPFCEQGALSDAEFDERMALLCDPQTSGGLLVAVGPERAEAFERAFEAAAGRLPARIGTAVCGEPGRISFSA